MTGKVVLDSGKVEVAKELKRLRQGFDKLSPDNP